MREPARQRARDCPGGGELPSELSTRPAELVKLEIGKRTLATDLCTLASAVELWQLPGGGVSEVQDTRKQEPGEALNQRDREILRDTIRSFILSGEPISSRKVAKQWGGSLSAATIRNAMADLEELGYLAQPHTSAGRVPTGAGYHLYIDSLMENRSVPSRIRRAIDEALAGIGDDPEQAMTSASHVLAEISRQIGIVMTPSLSETVLKAISFVRLSGSKVLCVVVSASGFVDNKVIETEVPLHRAELIRISNYLTDNFGGQTLRAVRDRLLELMVEERAKVDALLSKAIQLASGALLESPGQADLFVDGTTVVLDQPELNDLDRVRRLLDMFSDKVSLIRVLGELIDGPGVRVIIGQDSDLTSELDFSLVATRYGTADSSLGTVGIFGPSRMEYHKVIPLVDYLGERLSEALEKSLADA